MQIGATGASTYNSPKTSTTNTNSNSDTNINPKTKCWKFTIFCPWGSNWKPNKNTKQSRDNNKLVNSAKNPGSQRIPWIELNSMGLNWSQIGRSLQVRYISWNSFVILWWCRRCFKLLQCQISFQVIYPSQLLFVTEKRTFCLQVPISTLVRVLSLNMSDRKNSKLGDFQPVGYGSSFSNCSKDIISTIVKNVAMKMIMMKSKWATKS